jgi:hypothetical protein
VRIGRRATRLSAFRPFFRFAARRCVAYGFRMKRARVPIVVGALVISAAAGCGSHKPKSAPPVPAASVSASASVSVSPSASGSASAGPIPSEYTVQGTSVCAWQKTGGVIRLTAAFGVTYTGSTPPADVAYTVTDDATNTSEKGSILASMVTGDTATVVAGVSAPGFTAAVGRSVTLTITIEAPGDTDPTNNTAAESMTVPAAAATAKDTAQTVLDCDGP